MNRTPFYEIKIIQKEKPFSYSTAEIILGPFKVYRKQIIPYVKHLQKTLGRQVKVEFKRIKMTIKK